MRRKLGVIVLLFTMILGSLLSYKQPIKYIVNGDNDGEYEWNVYGGEEHYI